MAQAGLQEYLKSAEQGTVLVPALQPRTSPMAFPRTFSLKGCYKARHQLALPALRHHADDPEDRRLCGHAKLTSDRSPQHTAGPAATPCSPHCLPCRQFKSNQIKDVIQRGVPARPLPVTGCEGTRWKGKCEENGRRRHGPVSMQAHPLVLAIQPKFHLGLT